MKNKVRAAGILFDLDGVIIDSEKEYSRIWSYINELWPTGVEDLERVIKGCTLTSILENYFVESVRTEVTAKLYELEEKMNYYYAPGAENFLKRCKTLGIPIALVTSSDNKKMFHLKEEIPELLTYFDAVVTANDITHSKPHPEGYLLGAEKLGLRISDCIVVEDSLQGIEAGRAAGAKVIGITSTLGQEKIARATDRYVTTLAEITPDEIMKI